MVEHVSGLYLKGQKSLLLIWERHHNSLCFTNKIQMKKIIITKITGHLACRCCHMATRVAIWQQRHARRPVIFCNNYVQQTVKITLLRTWTLVFSGDTETIISLYIRCWKIIFHLLYYHNHKSNMSAGVSMVPNGNAFKSNMSAGVSMVPNGNV